MKQALSSQNHFIIGVLPTHAYVSHSVPSPLQQSQPNRLPALLPDLWPQSQQKFRRLPTKLCSCEQQRGSGHLALPGWWPRLHGTHFHQEVGRARLLFFQANHWRGFARFPLLLLLSLNPDPSAGELSLGKKERRKAKGKKMGEVSSTG